MTSLPITPPSTGRAGTALKSASPPSGAAGDFAALLDQTSARTAPAEGPKNRAAQPEPRRHDAATPKDDNKAVVTPDAQAAAAAAPAQAVAEPTQGQTPPQSGEVATESTQGQTSPQSGEVATAVAMPATPAADAVVAAALTAGAAAGSGPATSATGASAPSSGAAQAAVGALAAQSGSVDGAPPADAAATPAAGTPDGKLQIPAELLGKADAKGGHTKDFKNGDQPQRDLPPAPTLPPTADAAAAPTAAPAPAPPVADPSAAAAPAPTAVTQAQPAATPQTAVVVASGAPQLTRGSVLQTAERVQELVRIATTRAGNARAVLQLRPAELGQVDVHLRTTRNGLVATIAAHEQVGLDALQQAGNELRRTLENKGVQLHSLDLQLGTGQNGFSNQGDAREASSGRRGAASTHGLGRDDELVAEDELTITHAPSTPAGALVDVQA
ncbi:MAG TPA: flagellar hook-length control protein FliK [Baekduia sp.]|nr:flagellar hook-length control protein FliK [Baekduia sp.]